MAPELYHLFILAPPPVYTQNPNSAYGAPALRDLR
jgi:hypothetical protein